MKPKRDHRARGLPHYGLAECSPAQGAGQSPRLSARPHSESSSEEHNMDNVIVEELTQRLPTSELVKIIKGALDCGKQNRPFTQSDLLRAMTFGVTSTYLPKAREERPR